MDSNGITVRDAKTAMRAKIKAVLAEVTPDEIDSRSCRACENLMSTEAFKMARTILVYAPIDKEVDVSHLALGSFQESKIICLPKIDWEHKRMWPVVVNGFDDHSLVPDRYGLRTPKCGIPMPVDLIDLVVVPGLAFDSDGRRLGRGGGYYDRFLAQNRFGGRSLGLCFDCQIVDAVPAEPHDHVMEMIATERRQITVDQPRPQVDRR